MARSKVAISLDQATLGRLDQLVKRHVYPSRSQAIQEAVALDKERRRVREQLHELRERLEGLTDKQRESLERIGKGKSNREIAAELGVTLRAVELRRMTLIRKLNARTCTELLYYALMAAKKPPT